MDPSSLIGALLPFAGGATPASRGAIHLKLTEEVLQKLVAAAASNDQHKLRIDLGSNPAFLIEDESFPLQLDEAPALQSIAVKLGGNRPGWQPITQVSHRARVKPGLAARQKAGEGLRGNYQQTEQERAERRTVQLATPGGLPSRTASPSADSRNTSKTRQPSRLSAVPPKAPTSSFRLGKGAIPPGMAKSASATDSAALERSASLDRASAASAGPSLPAQDGSAAGQAVSPVRQPSSTSSEDSAVGGSHTSSSARTSLSSAGSPPGLTTTLPVSGVTAVKANGGLMKGKDTLKKEAKSASKAGGKAGGAKSPPSKASNLAKAASPPAPAKGKSAATSNKRSSLSTAQSDRDLDSDAGKKRRKLLNGVAEESTKSRRSESPARAPTPISSPKPSSSRTLKDKERDVKKKRASRPELRFTSSDEDEDAEGEEDVEMFDAPPPRDTKRTRITSHDPSDRSRNHLRATSANATASPLRAEIPISLIRIDSRADYKERRNQFNEGFGPYAKLHAQLDAERERLERGQQGEIDAEETERLVSRVERQRAFLENLKAAMADWVAREKAKAAA